MTSKLKLGTMGFATVFSLSLFVAQAVAGPRGRGPMDETTRAAMDACLTSAGLTPPQLGQRPSEAERTKMEAARAKVDACLKEKGISMPPHRHGPPPQDEQGGNPPPPPADGEEGGGRAEAEPQGAIQ